MDHKEAASIAAAIIGGLNRGQFSPSLIVQLCDYVTRPRTDPWRATSPVPDTPERLREFLFDNQFTDDARVKYLLGMCHAAIGELLAEVAKAKAAGVKPFTGERPALPTPPAKPGQLCAILSANKLTDDPYLRDLLDQCHGAMSSLDGEIKIVVDKLQQVRRAADGKQSTSYHPLVSHVIDLYQRANAPRVDPWQTGHAIPDDPEQLCAFILNNHLTDDKRMETLLLQCHATILALLGHNKQHASMLVEAEQALEVGWYDYDLEKPRETLPEAAKRVRGDLDRIRAAALPEQIAAVARQISEARGRWDDGCGKEINEVFRSCDTLLDAVRVLVSKEEAAKTCAIKAVDLLQREIAASLTPALIEQAVKLGTWGNGLSATASPGPWIAERGLVHMVGFKAPEIADCATRLQNTKGRYNDADFIAEARSVLPEMSALLLSIAKQAGNQRVLPEEIAAMLAWPDNPPVTKTSADPASGSADHQRAEAYARMTGQQQEEIEQLEKELASAKERADHNETQAVEASHRAMKADKELGEVRALLAAKDEANATAEAKAASEATRAQLSENAAEELRILLDQKIVDSGVTYHREELADIEALFDNTDRLATVCSGGPWSFSAAGDTIVSDAGRQSLAFVLEPSPNNYETRNYNGEFIAASRGLVVHLVAVGRSLVATVRHARSSLATVSSLLRDKEKQVAALEAALSPRDSKAVEDEQRALAEQKLAEAAEAAAQREAGLRRLIGKQEVAWEKRSTEYTAVQERLFQVQAEVVFLRDCLDRTITRSQEAESRAGTSEEELRQAKARESEALTTITELRAEIADHDRRLALQHSRTIAADRLWQKDTGRYDTMPDLGDLIAWLLKRAGAAEKKLAAAVEREKTTDSRIDELSQGIIAYRAFADGRADDIREDAWWTRAAVRWEKDPGGRILSAPDKARVADGWQPSHLVELAAAGLAVCREKGWKRDWQHGGGYLHLEVSEFVEALRGKGTSTPEAEAADVLFVLLTVCADNGVSLEKALAHLRELCRLPDGRIDVAGGAVYLIQDGRSYVGNDVSWWRPNSEGYTCQVEEAGLYDEAFARNRRDTDIVYRAADIYPLATRVVDIQRISSAGVKPVAFGKDPAR